MVEKKAKEEEEASTVGGENEGLGQSPEEEAGEGPRQSISPSRVEGGVFVLSK